MQGKPAGGDGGKQLKISRITHYERKLYHTPTPTHAYMAEEFIKPKCPKCGRSNIRFRTSREFEDKPLHCNICGFDWKAEPEPEKPI